MKKLLILAAFIFAVSMSVDAQNELLKSKKGVPILPQQGDYAIGINAQPVFSYFGNMFNATANNSIGFNFLNSTNAIFLKYMKAPDMAYRAYIRVGQTSLTQVAFVFDDADPDMEDQVEDKFTNLSTNVAFGLGCEKRRGIGRLQGYYGVEGMVMLTGSSQNYTYGNAYDSVNTMPTTTDWNNGNILPDGSRVLKNKDGMMIGLGVRAFVGVEYFILPKLSVGGEFGWGLVAGVQTKSETNSECWDFWSNEYCEYTYYNSKGSLINLDTDNMLGIVKLLFYF